MVRNMPVASVAEGLYAEQQDTGASEPEHQREKAARFILEREMEDGSAGIGMSREAMADLHGRDSAVAFARAWKDAD